jgi:hypothetical protein
MTTRKKYSVMRDELHIDESKKGIYCFLPWERVNKDDKAFFKVGLSGNLNRRVEDYHTYFPLGVYMCAFLEEPTKNRTAKETDRQYLEKIEKYIFDKAEDEGANVLYTSTRVKNKGRTEWLYSDLETILECFKMAHDRYGGKFHAYNIDHINNDAKQHEKLKPLYKAEIIMPIRHKTVVQYAEEPEPKTETRKKNKKK